MIDHLDLLKAPTPKEHRAISLKWLERIRPTLIDQWPEEIAALSMPTRMVEIPAGLLEEFFGLQDGKQPGPVMDAFAAELDAILGWDHKFVRLNSRSPKDWPGMFNWPVTCSGKEALVILSSSMRILDDLYEFKWLPEQKAHVCLRDFVPWIRPEIEFRCFVRGRRIVGVTHYDYTKPTPAPIVERVVEIRAAIDTWFAERLEPVLHVDDVVFDLAMKPDGEIVLIELNPYGLSDPCWFGSYDAIENASTPIEVGSTLLEDARDG